MTNGTAPRTDYLSDHPVFKNARQSEADQLLTAEALAERWSVKTAFVYRLAREGRLPAVRLGRYYRFSLPAIAEFEATGGTAAAE